MAYCLKFWFRLCHSGRKLCRKKFYNIGHWKTPKLMEVLALILISKEWTLLIKCLVHLVNQGCKCHKYFMGVFYNCRIVICCIWKSLKSHVFKQVGLLCNTYKLQVSNIYEMFVCVCVCVCVCVSMCVCVSLCVMFTCLCMWCV